MNQEYVVFPDVYYIHKIDHRNGNPDKSQWIIPEATERSCFESAFTTWRSSDFHRWGLHLEDGQAKYLGITKRSAPERRDLFVAKFIDSNRNSKWHGYPADHILNHEDIPPEDTLALWLTAHYLRPAIIRKLSKGQKCKL